MMDEYGGQRMFVSTRDLLGPRGQTRRGADPPADELVAAQSKQRSDHFRRIHIAIAHGQQLPKRLLNVGIGHRLEIRSCDGDHEPQMQLLFVAIDIVYVRKRRKRTRRTSLSLV